MWFSFKTYDISSHRKLRMLPSPGMVYTCWAGLQSNRTAVGNLQDTSITSSGKPCSIAWSLWGSQAPQLGGSAGFFPPLEMYAVTSGTVTASPQEGGFQVRTGSGPPCNRLHFTLLFSLEEVAKAFRTAWSLLSVLSPLSVFSLNSQNSVFSCSFPVSTWI